MDALPATVNLLAAQVAANYHAFMNIEHIDAVLFMLAGSALVGVVPYATKKYSGTIDATPPGSPTDYDILEDEPQALDDILSNAELLVPLPPAPNVLIPSIWGHPNTVPYTPSEPWNQALTLRARAPPTQATPWAFLGLIAIGLFILSALTSLIRRCCCGRRNNVAAAAADDDSPAEDPVNTVTSDQGPATPANSTAAASNPDNSLPNDPLHTTSLAPGEHGSLQEQPLSPQSPSVAEIASLHQRVEELRGINGTLTKRIKEVLDRKDTVVTEARAALRQKETVEAQNEHLAQQLDNSQKELASLRTQLAGTNKRVSDSESATPTISERERKLQEDLDKEHNLRMTASSELKRLQTLSAERNEELSRLRRENSVDRLQKRSSGQGNDLPASHKRSLTATSETPSIDSLYTDEHGQPLPTQPAQVTARQSTDSIFEQYHIQNLPDEQELENTKGKPEDTKLRLGDCESFRIALQQQSQRHENQIDSGTEHRVKELHQRLEELAQAKTEEADQMIREASDLRQQLKDTKLKCEQGREHDGERLKTCRESNEIQRMENETLRQQVETQQDRYNKLYAQYEHLQSQIENENSALIEAKEREEELEDNFRVAENEIDMLKERIERLKRSSPFCEARPDHIQQELNSARATLEVIRKELKDEQGKLDDCKTKRKQQAGDAQYSKALEQQSADLRLQLEEISAARTNAVTTDSVADIALEDEIANLAYAVEQKDRTISDLKKQASRWQNQVRATEGQAAYEDFRARAELTDQVERGDHTIAKLTKQIEELEGRFLAAEGQASAEDFRARSIEASGTISMLKADKKKLEVRLQRANAELDGRIPSTPVVTGEPTTLTPVPPHFPASTVQIPQHNTIDVEKDVKFTVIDTNRTNPLTPTTPRTPSLLGEGKYASWKCSHCKCSFSGGKVGRESHEDLCRKWYEDHVYKRDMTLEIKHPQDWEEADPPGPDATEAEWVSSRTDKLAQQKQLQRTGLHVTNTGLTPISVTPQGPQTPLTAEALEFTPRSATLPSDSERKSPSTADTEPKSKDSDSSKAAKETDTGKTSDISEDDFETTEVTEAAFGEDQRAAIVESTDTTPENNDVDNGELEGHEYSASESTDTSREFDLGDQSAEADAIQKTIRSASGGRDDVVGYINGGGIPVYAEEVDKYVNNPDYDFKWARGKRPNTETESERNSAEEIAEEEAEKMTEVTEVKTEQKAEDTKLEDWDQVEKECNEVSETISASASPTSGGTDIKTRKLAQETTAAGAVDQTPAKTVVDDAGASPGSASGSAESNSESQEVPTDSKSSPSSELVLLNGELEIGASRENANNSPMPDQGLASSSQSKTEGDNDAGDPQKPISESATAPATTSETDRGVPAPQKLSNTEVTTMNGTISGPVASASDQIDGIPAPSNRNLKTYKLPLRNSPEGLWQGRQGMGGSRPAGPKLDLTKPSDQRGIFRVLNTPKIVKNNSKISSSLSGSRFAPGSPHQPVTPGRRTPLPINSSTASPRINLATPKTLHGTSGKRQSNASTPNIPPNAPTGPTGKNTCGLCGATFTDTEAPKWSFRRNHLPKCRAWKTEWAPHNYAKQNGDPSFPPQWNNERTQRPSVDPAWLVTAKKVQSGRNDKMKRAFFVDDTPEAAATVPTEQQSDVDTVSQDEGAVEENIAREKREIIQGIASVKNARDSASNVDLEGTPTKSRSEQNSEPSPGGTKPTELKTPASPWSWENDKEDSGADYRVPSWAAEPQDAGVKQSTSQTDSSKQEQGGKIATNNKAEQRKGSTKQAGSSSAHDAAASPTPSPVPVLTPSHIPTPASVTLASDAPVTPGRNQVLVDVPLSTPTFVLNSGRSPGGEGGFGGSRWASPPPTGGLLAASPDAGPPNPQTSPGGRGGWQTQKKGRGRGGGKKR